MLTEVVVTGATGFIGRSVLAAIDPKRFKVFAVSRHASQIDANDGIEWVNYDDLPNLPFQNGLTLLHLAEPSHVASIEEQGERHIAFVTAQARMMLSLPFKAAVYASSATVYGDGWTKPHSPEDPISENSKVYAQAKISVEAMFKEKNGTIARITNIYGKGMSEKNIFSDILSQLDAPGDVIVLRELSPVRDYLYISDLVACLLAMVQQPKAGIYNIASAETISCEELAKTILSAYGLREKQVISQNPDRNSHLALDISHTCSTFDWSPKTDIKTGITNLLKDRRSQ